jgi:hypothetical protein
MSSAAVLICALVVGQNSPRVLTPPGPEIGPDYVLTRPTWVYEPPYFTCYSHHRNRLDCYPGFHEQYYRRPYNYRVLFDYPWHEDVHGPVPAGTGDGACGEAWVEEPSNLAPPRGGDFLPHNPARAERSRRATLAPPPVRRAAHQQR